MICLNLKTKKIQFDTTGGKSLVRLTINFTHNNTQNEGSDKGTRIGEEGPKKEIEIDKVLRSVLQANNNIRIKSNRTEICEHIFRRFNIED